MTNEPAIEQRKAQPYAVISRWTTAAEIATVLPPLIRRVDGWLQQKKTDPSGPPFFEYRVMDKEKMHVCVGFPVSAAVAGDDEVHAGAFPEGIYAVVTHTGPYTELNQVNADLNRWFEEKGYAQRFLDNAGPVRSGSRTEFYPTDPVQEPDESRWVTHLAVWVEKRD